MTIKNKRTDFVAYNHGSVWTIEAVTPAARQFAELHFETEGWRGLPTNFTTDWRPARDLCERLVDEGWIVRGERE